MKKTFRRIGALFLSVSLLCSLQPIHAKAASFGDVPSDSWYASAVDDLVSQGIIQGTSASTFSPYGRLTRAAFVTMLAKTVLTQGDLNQYRFKGNFKDVKETHWANPYVNWASETGVVKGYEDKSFKPDKAVSRQDMAVMVVNFSRSTGRKILSVKDPAIFEDSDKIAKYALSSVNICQQAGIISGYKEDNTFRPNGVAIRAEAASLYSRFLKNCKTGNYKIVRKRVYTTPVSAVEFDPSLFTAGLAMGRDLVDGGESPSSLVSRTGAVIAANAAFFDMESYMPLGTLISEGRVLTVDNKYAPDKSAFAMNSKGSFSIENFSTLHTLSVFVEKEEMGEPKEPVPEAEASEQDSRGESAEEEIPGENGVTIILRKLGFNRWPNNEKDATRIIYTRDWGHTLCFPAKDAVTVDENGIITSVDHDKDVDIPEKGFVIAQRARRQYEGPFFDVCKPGMSVDLQQTFQGVSTEDIKLSIGAGPCLVKQGQVYGDQNTYRAEGFSDPNIIEYSARRVCVGIKKDGKLLILTAYTTLKQLSKIMVSFGCTDAINFDGGGSANIYVDGQWLCGPQDRKLNSMLYFK